jgi:hypothetical protein
VNARTRGVALLLLALAASGLLVGLALARGGADRGTLQLANPCRSRPPIGAGGTGGTIEQVVLDGLDGAACHLRLSREKLVVGLASDTGRRHILGTGGTEDDRTEEAIRSGLRRAIDDAHERGRLGGLELTLLRAATDHLPIAELMAGYQRISG